MKILLFLFRHPIKPGNQYLENYAGLTCLTLSCKLGRDDLFMDMLELSCKEFWRYSNICCSGKFVITFAFSEFLSLNINLFNEYYSLLAFKNYG